MQPDGILTHHGIEALIAERQLAARDRIEPIQIQPASFDLRVGEVGYRIRSGFLPHRGTVEDHLQKLKLYDVDLTRGAVLEKGHIYLLSVLESLRLEQNLAARANPKSSTGRLDVFTRVITDHASRFDELAPGYRGPLFIEVVPRSFPIRVRTGSRLNQLRFIRGRARLTDRELQPMLDAEPLVLDDQGRWLQAKDLQIQGGAIALRVQLRAAGGASGGVIGYRARTYTGIIDVDAAQSCDPEEYWHALTDQGDAALILHPEDFYIFASQERIRVPLNLAAEMLPYDVGIGELRTNYAGFFDSGFGYGDGSLNGSQAVLEVRPHDVPFLIEDGQVLFRLAFDRTVTPCEKPYGGSGLGSSYQGQGLALSKHFRTPRT